MIYISNGVEIQYRECQILRDTAKNVLQKRRVKTSLQQYREEWIAELGNLAENNKVKRKYAVPLSNALKTLPDDLFQAVSEYAEFLVKKGMGIDIMERFTSTNLLSVLPVNVHEGMDDLTVEE